MTPPSPFAQVRHRIGVPVMRCQRDAAPGPAGTRYVQVGSARARP